MTFQIKFSHEYDKLKGLDLCAPVRLLEVFLKDEADLHPVFRGYDTAFSVVKDGLMQMGFFALPKGQRLLVLLFQDKAGKLFTTMRRCTPENSRYYMASRGEFFKVVIEE